MARKKKCMLVITNVRGMVTKRIECETMVEARKLGKSSDGFRWLIQDMDEYEILDSGKCAGL